MEELEQFYRANFDRYVKQYTNRAGTKESAEDAVQEAFVRALKYWDSYDPTHPLDTWFNRIISNALKHQKSMDKGRVNHEEFDEANVDGTDCRMLNQRLWRQIQEEIKVYDGQHYEILSLYFEHQYQPRDICKVVDMKYKTVETFLQRFKLMIKEKYGEKL